MVVLEGTIYFSHLDDKHRLLCRQVRTRRQVRELFLFHYRGNMLMQDYYSDDLFKYVSREDLHYFLSFRGTFEYLVRTRTTLDPLQLFDAAGEPQGPVTVCLVYSLGLAKFAPFADIYPAAERISNKLVDLANSLPIPTVLAPLVMKYAFDLRPLWPRDLANKFYP